jgi:hypothetical protein
VSSSERLHWQTPLGDKPGENWIRSYSVVRTMFFPYCFRRERGEVLLSFAIMGHIFRCMVKSNMENDMEVEFLMTSNDDLSLVFVALRNLLGDL